MEVSGPKETLKGKSENKVLKIGHLIIQSLNGHQNPDSGLKSLLPKEDLQGSIKVRHLYKFTTSLLTLLHWIMWY